jgi:hypothetical protein
MAEVMDRVYLAQERDKLIFCGQGNGTLGSINCGEYFNYKRNDWIINRGR